MKKSNLTITATGIILLHIIALALLVQCGRQEEATPAPAKPVAAPQQERPASPPSKVIPLEVPQLAPPSATAPASARTAVVQTEQIATPERKEGFLRKDKSSRRTSKVYANLIGNPYQGAIVVDARTGKILYENRATAYAYPASITKMMTMLIVLEEIDAGRVRLDDRVEITKEVSGIGGSEIYLDPRESGAYTVDDLLKALTIHSANDAARALALHIAGSRDRFVEMMNRKARQLGMNATTYHTEHGLPPSDGSQPDISTAYDIALLSMAVLRNPRTLKYTGSKLEWLPTSSIRKDRFMLANRNALISREPYPGCDGLKTGYHSRGGYSLSATAKREGQRVISVILGVSSRDDRNAQTRDLLDRGFSLLSQ